MSTRQCYALLVGIDKYLSPVPALDGCVNDMRAMRDYLKRHMQRAGIPLHLVVLENERATRLNIVEKFENHLGQAEQDDIVFFYFSGHGSQEKTHEIFFPLEADKRNETLVCFDSRMPDGMDLADKEVATLLDVAARQNPHVVVIYDCCNSGSGTRNAGLLEEAEVKVRAFDQLPPQTRSLDDYILPRDLNTDRSVFSVSEPTRMIVPNPRHIHLAAAQSFQLAKETYLGGSPRGVFTYSLVEVLEKSQGDLSYGDVIRRVRSLVTGRTFDQNPQLHATDPDDLDLLFLNGSTQRAVNYYALTYDQDQGWLIDAGSIQGIATSGNQGRSTLWVYPTQATPEDLRDPSRALGLVAVREVGPTTSKVRPQGNLYLSKDQSYQTMVHDMAMAAMPVYISSTAFRATDQLRQALEGHAEAQLFLKEVRRPAEADYLVLSSAQDEYYLTRQTNADALPLTEPVPAHEQAGATQLVDQLVHIARWERVLDLQNPGSSLSTEAMKVEVLHPDRDEPIAPERLGLVFRYQDGGALPSFRVRLVNRSRQRLYGSLLYLSSQFAIDSGALPQGGIWLEPGEVAWAADGSPIRGQIAPEQLRMGRHEVHETFKLIFATEAFDGRLMRQPELGQPRPVTRGLEEQTQTRALLFGTGSSTSRNDWNSNQVSITLIKTDA